MPDTLELRRIPKGATHYLHGRLVEVGTELDLWLEDSSQVRGRYELRPDGQALFILWLRGGTPVEVALPPSARLSWPDARDGNRLVRLEQIAARTVAHLEAEETAVSGGPELLHDARVAIGATAAERSQRCLRCGQTGHVGKPCPV